MAEAAMTCREARERIDGMLPGEIGGEGACASIRGHLEGCAECRRYLEKSRALAATLDGWRVPEPRKNMHAAVMTAVAREERERREYGPAGGFGEQLRGLFSYRFRVPAAAALAVVVLLGISLAWNLVQLGRITGEPGMLTTAKRTAPDPGTRDVDAAPTPGEPSVEDLTRFAIHEGLTGEGGVPDALRRGVPSVPVIVILGMPPWLYPQPAQPAPNRRSLTSPHTREGNI